MIPEGTISRLLFGPYMYDICQEWLSVALLKNLIVWMERDPVLKKPVSNQATSDDKP